jgi:hypothetical protein
VSALPALQWSQADAAGISIDAGINAWHAGIVKGVLATSGGSVVVATDTGGIWSVGEAGTGTCLIDADKPNMWCVAQGPDGDEHLFAGGETLFETDVGQTDPLLSWNEVSVTDAGGNPVGTIYNVVVQLASRRIVVATASGVYWALIPEPAGSSGRRPSAYRAGTPPRRLPYEWVAAKGLPPGAFGSLALGPASGHLQDVIAAAWGSNIKSGLYGLFYGTWDNVQGLIFERATISDADPTQMCYTAVASCSSFPAKLYASASNSAGNLVALLTSGDGGRTWSILPAVVLNDPNGPSTLYTYCTGQGNDPDRPCNALGVGPITPGLVVIGWIKGPFFSTDGGATFTYISSGFDPNPGDGSKYAHLHSDFHSVHFDVNDPSGTRLYIGSDGGLVRTDDLGTSFVSAFNQRLLNLQLLGTTAARQWYGMLGCSPTVPGLIASGTQDNGNVFYFIGSSEPAWTSFDGGDGRITAFLANGALVHNNNGDDRPRLSLWDGSTFQSRGVILYGGAGVLHSPIFERVEQPAYRNAEGRLMYGTAGIANSVYGLFGDENGDNTAWEHLADVASGNFVISAVASRDGTAVFVGTLGGLLFLVDSSSDVPVALPNVALSNPDGDPAFMINRIVVASAACAFASFNSVDSSSTSAVLRWDGESWTIVAGGFPGSTIYAMEIDTTGDVPVLYIAVDASVYGSADLGETWTDVSAGLPRRCHTSDLRFYQDRTGHYLYLSTFGRSVWIARTFSHILGRPD